MIRTNNKFDITGKKFDYWTVIQKDNSRSNARNTFWICKCKCGNTRSVSRSSLVRGRSKSCGCRPSEKRKGINKTHGLSKTRIYHEWTSMRRRCKNEKDRFAKSYFEKGIRVCDEWESDFMAFYNWAMKNGYDDSLTIDRIDNDKGYSPENCRWITIGEQQSNKTNTVRIDYNGETYCLRQLCAKIGFPYKTAHRRYKRMEKKNAEINIDKLFEPIHEDRIPMRNRKNNHTISGNAQ